MTDLNITCYYDELNTAIEKRDSKAIAETIYNLTHSQLLNSVWETEVFNFFIDFLQREDFVKLNVSLHMIMHIHDDYNKISKKQKKVLFDYFEEKIPNTAHSDFLFGIADLIARQHSKEEAFLTFKKWFNVGSPAHKYIGKSGLETLLIISRREEFEPEFIKKIKSVLGWYS